MDSYKKIPPLWRSEFKGNDIVVPSKVGGLMAKNYLAAGKIGRLLDMFAPTISILIGLFFWKMSFVLFSTPGIENFSNIVILFLYYFCGIAAFCFGYLFIVVASSGLVWMIRKFGTKRRKLS